MGSYELEMLQNAESEWVGVAATLQTLKRQVRNGQMKGQYSD
jgi:hypothetical protein